MSRENQQVLNNDHIDIEDTERVLKRYQQNLAAIRCSNCLIADIETLTTNTTIEIETKVKLYIRAKRKQINKLEEQNKKISSLIQRLDNPTEAEVVCMYYFENSQRKKPRRDIAEEICYDEAYTSQIKNKALKHLSERIVVEELEELLQIIRLNRRN